MNRASYLAAASLALGLIILYVGWGGTLELFPVGPTRGCADTDLQGLHLSSYGTLDYAADRCHTTYQRAYLAFFSLTVVGLTLLWGGLRLRERSVVG